MESLSKPPLRSLTTPILVMMLLTAFAQAQTSRPATPPSAGLSHAPLNPDLPTLFVVGDSTASNGPRNGWGDPLANYFDPAKINARNRALGGRSSRSYIEEGHWDAVLKEMKPGDFVLIQWGQNDGGALDTGRARGSLPGLGEETKDILMPASGPTGPIEPPPPGTHRIVHTFGWYMRQYVADVKAKGATTILMSLTAKDIWDNGKNRHPYDDYPKWIAATAKSENVMYMDFNTMMGEKFNAMGQAKVHALFPRDTTHTNETGADLNAQGVIAGLKYLNSPLVNFLSEKGNAIEAYRPALAGPMP